MFMRSQRSIPDDEKTRFVGGPVWAIGGLWRTRVGEGKTRGAGHSAPGEAARITAIVYAATLDGEETRARATAGARPGAATTSAGTRTTAPTRHYYSAAARLLIGEP